jgi:hypothetical protein
MGEHDAILSAALGEDHGCAMKLYVDPPATALGHLRQVTVRLMRHAPAIPR